MSIELNAIKFAVETGELEKAITMIGQLGAAVQKVSKDSKSFIDAQNKTQVATEKAGKATAERILLEEKAALVSAKREALESKLANTTTKAAGDTTRAQEGLSNATKTAISLQEKQQAILEVMAMGFSKGQSSILSTEYAVNGVSDAFKDLGKILDSQRKLIGGDPFDKSLSVAKSYANQLNILKDANNAYTQGAGLTVKQLQDLAMETERVIERSRLEGKTTEQTTQAVMKMREEVTRLALAINMQDTALKSKSKAETDAAKATMFIDSEMQKMLAHLDQVNDGFGRSATNALLKFTNALKASKKPLGEAIGDLIAYRDAQAKAAQKADKSKTDYITRAVGPQITDIFVGLSTGQSPLTVLLQQGGQLRDQFGMMGIASEKMADTLRTAAKGMKDSVIDTGKAVVLLGYNITKDLGQGAANAMLKPVNAMRELVIRMAAGEEAAKRFNDAINMGPQKPAGLLGFLAGGAVLAVVATLVLVAKGLYDISTVADDLNKVLVTQGATLGFTSDRALELANSMKIAGASQTDIIEAIGAFAKSGGLLKEELVSILPTAIRFAKVTGQSIDDVAKQFSRLKKEPGDALADMGVAMGTIDPAITRLVYQYQSLGDTSSASALALKAAAQGMKDSTDLIELQEGRLTSFGRAIKEVYTSAADAIRGLFYESGTAEKQKDILKLNSEIVASGEKLKAAQKSGSGFFTKMYAQEILDLGAKKKVLTDDIARAQGLENNRSSNALQNETTKKIANAAEQARKKPTSELVKSMTEEEYVAKKVNELIGNGVEARIAWNNAAKDGLDIQTKFRKEYQDALKKANKEDTKPTSLPVSDLGEIEKNFNRDKMILERNLSSQLQIKKDAYKAGLLTDEEYRTQELAIVSSSLKKELDLVQKAAGEKNSEIERQRKELNTRFSGQTEKAAYKNANEKLDNESKGVAQALQDQKAALNIEAYKLYSDTIIDASKSVNDLAKSLKEVQRQEDVLSKNRAVEQAAKFKALGATPEQAAYIEAYAAEEKRLNEIQSNLESRLVDAKAKQIAARNTLQAATLSPVISESSLKGLSEIAAAADTEVLQVQSDLKGLIATAGQKADSQGLVGTLNKQLENYKSIIQEVKNIDIGSSMIKGFDGVTNAIGFTIQAFNRMSKAQADFNAVQKNSNQEEQKKNAEDFARAQIGQYADLANAAKQYFGEKTAAAKAANVIEMGLRAAQLAMAIKHAVVESGLIEIINAEKIAGWVASAGAAVISAGTSIAALLGIGTTAATVAPVVAAAGTPGPAAFVAFAAMAALVASLGFAVAGGGNSGSFAPTNTGTGTVLGDSSARSESLSKSFEQLKDIDAASLKNSGKMLQALRAIENNTASLGNLVLTNNGLQVQSQSVSTGFQTSSLGKVAAFGQNTLAKALQFTGIDRLTGGALSGITKAVGNLIGGLFGTKTSIQGQGLNVSSQNLGDIVKNGTASTQYYTDVKQTKKSFGFTTSTNSYTMYSQADAEISRQIGLIFSNIVDSVKAAAEPLGKTSEDIANQIKSINVSLGRVQTSGLTGEELNKTLTNVFSSMSDQLAKILFPGLEAFQKVGEGYYQTTIRVASGIESARDTLDRLGIKAVEFTNITSKQGDVAAELVRQSIMATESVKGISDIIGGISGTGKEIADVYSSLVDLKDTLVFVGVNANMVTSTLIRGAGGFEAMQSALESFQSNFMTESERLRAQTVKMQTKFTALGLTMPKTAAEFKALVASLGQDSSEAGQLLLGKVLGLSDGVAQVTGSLDDATNKMKDFTKTILDYVDSLTASTSSLTTSYDIAETQFMKQIGLAKAGNSDAMGSITSYADKLLSAGKDKATTNVEYQRLVGSVKSELLALTTGESTSTMLSSSATGSSVQNTNSVSTPIEQTRDILSSILTKLSEMQAEDRAEGESIATNLGTIARVIKRVDNGESIRTTAV